MLSPTVVRCDKELEILHAVYLSVIILLVIIIVVAGVNHWRIRRGPGTFYLLHTHALQGPNQAFVRNEASLASVRGASSKGPSEHGPPPPLRTPFYLKIEREGKICYFVVQGNPVNPVTNGPQKSGRINGVVVLKGFCKEENECLSFLSVLTGWS